MTKKELVRMLKALEHTVQRAQEEIDRLENVYVEEHRKYQNGELVLCKSGWRNEKWVKAFVVVVVFSNYKMSYRLKKCKKDGTVSKIWECSYGKEEGDLKKYKKDKT